MKSLNVRYFIKSLQIESMNDVLFRYRKKRTNVVSYISTCVRKGFSNLLK